MDGKAYLDQIASTTRPTKKPGMGGITSSPFFKVIAVGVVAFIVVIIAGVAIGNSKSNLKEQTISLKMQIDNTMSVVSGYKSLLKSSILRSNSSSLYGILSNTSGDLQNYLQNKYNYKGGKEYAKLQEAADSNKDALKNDLFNAKINGMLDRVYAHKMTYEISTIMARESNVYNASGDEALKSLLETSYKSLNSLYEEFNNFSETK